MRRRTMSGTPDEARALIEDVCRRYRRVVVVGRPGIGKTTLTRGLDFWETDEVLSETDDWTAQREKVVLRMDGRTDFRCEGVTAARALRHGLTPEAVVLLTGEPMRATTPAADRLGVSVEKWTDEGVRATGADLFVFRIVGGPRR